MTLSAQIANANKVRYVKNWHINAIIHSIYLFYGIDSRTLKSGLR